MTKKKSKSADFATTAAGITAAIALCAKTFFGHELSPDIQKACEMVVAGMLMFIGYHVRK